VTADGELVWKIEIYKLEFQFDNFSKHFEIKEISNFEIEKMEDKTGEIYLSLK
jgi:hypothetical protein